MCSEQTEWSARVLRESLVNNLRQALSAQNQTTAKCTYLKQNAPCAAPFPKEGTAIVLSYGGPAGQSLRNNGIAHLAL